MVLWPRQKKHCATHLSNDVIVLANQRRDLFVESGFLFRQHLDSSIVFVDLSFQLCKMSTTKQLVQLTGARWRSVTSHHSRARTCCVGVRTPLGIASTRSRRSRELSSPCRPTSRRDDSFLELSPPSRESCCSPTPLAPASPSAPEGKKTTA